MAQEPQSDGAATAAGGPIFIVSSGGSGSTLLRLILDSHPNIAIPRETCFMRLVKAHDWVPYWAHGPKWHGRLGVEKDELDAALGAFYGGFFERFAAREGKKRWGDKTPFHVWHMERITRLFPTAVFVGIVRHPGGTMASMMKRFSFRKQTAVTHWLEMNRQLVYEGCRFGDRFVLVRYEDLLLHPEETLRELVAWLGEPWSPAVLEHHEVQPAKGAPRMVDGRTLTDDPIDAARVSSWTTTLDGDDRRRLQKTTGEWARFFGYDVVDPVPVEPLAAETSTRRRIVTGVELAERRTTFGGRVDFSKPSLPYREGIFRPGSPGERAAAARNGRGQNGRRELLVELGHRLPAPVRRAATRARRLVANAQRS